VTPPAEAVELRRSQYGTIGTYSRYLLAAGERPVEASGGEVRFFIIGFMLLADLIFGGAAVGLIYWVMPHSKKRLNGKSLERVA